MHAFSGGVAYQQLLNTQVAMVKNGTVSGLEFFFGYFGENQDFPGWLDNPHYCDSTRLSACYANTTTLQNMTLNTLTSAFSTSTGTPAITLQYTSVYMGAGIVGHQGTPANVWLKSTGTANLKISNIQTAGTNGLDFHVTSNCLTTLAPGPVLHDEHLLQGPGEWYASRGRHHLRQQFEKNHHVHVD